MKRYLVIYLLYILEENKFLGSLKSELFNKIDRVARFHGGRVRLERWEAKVVSSFVSLQRGGGEVDDPS